MTGTKKSKVNHRGAEGAEKVSEDMDMDNHEGTKDTKKEGTAFSSEDMLSAYRDMRDDKIKHENKAKAENLIRNIQQNIRDLKNVLPDEQNQRGSELQQIDSLTMALVYKYFSDRL